MDTKNPTTGNLPTDQPSDLSFQVMPTDNGPFETKAPAPSVPKISQPSPMPTVAKTPSAPLPSKSGYEFSQEPEPSFFRSKWIYILVGVIVVIALGVLAYFMLGSKKNAAPVVQTPASKLPNVWLQQYFAQNLNADGSCNDQTICGDSADPDNDGLKNYDEFVAGTNPNNPDTDGDGIADGDEVNIYKTDPNNKYTDSRDIVAQNNWTDGFQIMNGYDPLTPGLKFTDVRNQQIAADTTTFGLHEPTITTLNPASATSPVPNPAPTSPTTNPTTPSPVTTPNTQTTAPPTAKTVSVTIQNMAFIPSTTTINKGDTVIWTNKDTIAHTVTGDNGGPASTDIPSNGTYSYTFNTAGTFAYHCSIHPTMTGSVVVN